MEVEEEMEVELHPHQDIILHSSIKNFRDTNLLDLGRQLLAQAKLGNGEKVKALVAAGAPFTADWVGTSPIHWTAHYNYIDVTELLLRSGISPDARNKVDRTPLHVACQKGHLEIVRLLIAFGADVNARDMIRMSPLHWASVSGNKEIVRILLDHGAAILPVNKFGKTAAQIAEDHSYYDVIKVIEEVRAIPVQERSARVAIKRKESHLIGQKMKLEESNNTTQQSFQSGDILKMVAKRRKIGIIVNKTENGSNKIQVVENDVKTKIVTQGNRFLDNNTEQAIQMLKEHGITMLEPDNGTVVSSAVQGGQSIKLTEAGKLALISSKVSTPSTTVSVAKPTVSIPVTTATSTTPSSIKVSPTILPSKSPIKLLPNGQKIITIKADQLINMTKEKKVIIKQARPVPNARIFDGKLYTISQRDELAAKLKEKRGDAISSINEKKKILKEMEERMIKTKKEIEDLTKQVTNYDQTISQLFPKTD